MIFSEAMPPVRILSVLELSWDAARRYAKPRPFHALSYRITGSAEFVHDGLSTNVKQGDVAFVPAGYDYALHSTSEHLYVVHFDLQQYQAMKMSVFTPANSNILEKSFKMMYSIWHGKQIGYQNATTSIFYKLMEQIQKQHTEQGLLSPSAKMKAAVEYLHENFTDSNLSVALLSEMAEMSDTYFRKLFIKSFSITPLKYINRLRLSYAEELLRSGYYTIEAVAGKVGFSDPKYFSTFIKKSRGIPPSRLYKNI